MPDSTGMFSVWADAGNRAHAAAASPSASAAKQTPTFTPAPTSAQKDGRRMKRADAAAPESVRERLLRVHRDGPDLAARIDGDHAIHVVVQVRSGLRHVGHRLVTGVLRMCALRHSLHDERRGAIVDHHVAVPGCGGRAGGVVGIVPASNDRGVGRPSWYLPSQSARRASRGDVALTVDSDHADRIVMLAIYPERLVVGRV